MRRLLHFLAVHLAASCLAHHWDALFDRVERARIWMARRGWNGEHMRGAEEQLARAVRRNQERRDDSL